MTSIRNIVSLMAAIPTMLPTPTPTATPGMARPRSETRSCGEVNVFYTGLPPYHPWVAAQGWDTLRVEIGLKNETVNLVKAGYNVHIVWAGPEIAIPVLEDRISQTGVNFDIAAVGFGVRSSKERPIVERFEDLVDMYYRKLPNARKVYNHSPESLLWSVTHRMPMSEDCEAANKPGKLLGYEEICDDRCLNQQQNDYNGRRHLEL